MELNKTLIIGEIGINHNGSIKTALKLIKECKKAGVDVVKFQKRSPDICVPEDQKNILKDTPWGQMTYLKYKKTIEFEKKQYDIIDRFCKKIGIQWTASVWDIPSFHFINSYSVPFIKIPSALITNSKLIEEIKMFSVHPIIISGGMSTIAELDQAVRWLGNKLYGILHCNSSYPCDYSEIDIRVIDMLKQKYSDIIIGYSGHEVDLLPTIVAVSAGAKIIERHVTIDRTMWGTDQQASLEIIELSNLVSTIRNIEIILGKSELTVYPSEIIVMKKLRKINN
jgi:N-acetylneuraminate synthase